MLKKFTRLKLLDKILIISGLTLLAGLVLYVFFSKRPDRHFVVPAGYEGWVTIRYEKPDASPFPLENGAIMIRVSDSGYAETSDRYMKGWGRDEFFTLENGKEIPLEYSRKEGVERVFRVHHRLAEYKNWDDLIVTMEPNSDTSLFDGTKISREDTTVSVNAGRKLMQHFYLTNEYKKEFYEPPAMPPHRKKW
ncbi:MAG: hypothetical protein H6581_01590 [Bacteroidia bacterium]|nr:hypothetical protein [Bacteroidia bacterium]